MNEIAGSDLFDDLRELKRATAAAKLAIKKSQDLKLAIERADTIELKFSLFRSDDIFRTIKNLTSHIAALCKICDNQAGRWYEKHFWHPSDGQVLWCGYSEGHKPTIYLGTPLEKEWVEGIYTHFTHLPEIWIAAT